MKNLISMIPNSPQNSAEGLKEKYSIIVPIGIMQNGRCQPEINRVMD